jgi:hypothetical protein
MGRTSAKAVLSQIIDETYERIAFRITIEGNAAVFGGDATSRENTVLRRIMAANAG